MTDASTKAPKMRVLNRVLFIHYRILFRKDKKTDVLALLDSASKIKAITLAYTAHLDLAVRVINVGMQKIDRSSLATYNIVIAALHVVDKLGCSWFF